MMMIMIMNDMNKIQCVVLYDFQPRSEHEMKVVQGDFVTALEIAGEWTKVQNENGNVSFRTPNEDDQCQ